MTTISETMTGLTEEAKSLRDQIDNLLLSLSPEEMQEEQIKRDEFRNRCQKVYNAVKDKISDMEAICRKLREIKADQAHDNKKLDAHKWDLLTSRKNSSVK